MNSRLTPSLFPQLVIRQSKPADFAPKFHGVELPADARLVETIYRGLPCAGWAARQTYRAHPEMGLDKVLRLSLECLRQEASELADIAAQDFEAEALRRIRTCLADIFGTLNWPSAESTSAAHTEKVPGTSRDAVILTADSDPVSRFMACDELRIAGLQAHGAENGAEVLLLAGLSQPDLILMDANLDTVDSLRACKWLKQSRFSGNPEIIFLTGENDRSAIARSMDAGGDDWINKPFKADEGLARIRTYLEMRRLRQDLASRQPQPASRLAPAPETAPALLNNPGKNSLTKVEEPLNELSNRLANSDKNSPAESNEQKGVPALEECAFNLEPTRKDLAPLLRLATWIYTDQASRKDVHLQLDAPVSGLLAMSDEILIQRVLENLLSNAIKFSPPGATVTLAARHAGDRLRVWVDDEGQGVPAEKQAGLFSNNRTLAGRPSREAIDSGAGLGACKRIITAHGGVISLQNRSEGGAHFEFCLPAAPADATTCSVATKGRAFHNKISAFAAPAQPALANVA